MPWWSWLLIWTGLGLALLGMLAWFGFRLFRKLMRTLRALEDLGGMVDLDPGPVASDAVRFTPAVFRSHQELSDAAQLQRAAAERRRQLRRDRLVQRSKLMTQTPLNQRTDPHA